MLYRAWIDGKWFITPNVALLDQCDSVDIFINKIWQVFR